MNEPTDIPSVIRRGLWFETTKALKCSLCPDGRIAKGQTVLVGRLDDKLVAACRSCESKVLRGELD